MQSKIQVTPTQVEFELKLGCDNNIGLDMLGCSFCCVSLMVWFSFVKLGPCYQDYFFITFFKSTPLKP